MPLDHSWTIAFHLILDGLLLGIGWFLANAIYSAILWVLNRGGQTR